jgi:hypothetical protein
MWLKFRHKWAYGLNHWEWRFLDVNPVNINDSWVKETVAELNDQYAYSDKYRGLDYEVVEFPSVEVVEEHIKQTQKAILWRKQQLNYCRRILPECSIRDIMES